MNFHLRQLIWFYLLLSLVITGCSPYRAAGPRESLYRLAPHYIVVQDGRIEYYRLGKGSPIVLIPGYLTDISSWNRPFISALAQHHQVIVFNNRNVGGSFTRSTQYQSQDLAKDTHQLIKGLHLKKPAVLGISMGGMIAQQLAVLYPQSVGQLILINTAIAGKQLVPPNAQVEQQMLDMPNSKLGSFRVALNLFFPSSWRWRMGWALAAQRFQPKDYTQINTPKVKPQQQQLLIHWIQDDSTAEKIAQLHLPVLILNGKADDVIPPVNSEILAYTIPHSQFMRWQEGGHAMIYQYPEGLAAAIHRFII